MPGGSRNNSPVIPQRRSPAKAGETDPGNNELLIVKDPQRRSPAKAGETDTPFYCIVTGKVTARARGVPCGARRFRTLALPHEHLSGA